MPRGSGVEMGVEWAASLSVSLLPLPLDLSLPHPPRYESGVELDVEWAAAERERATADLIARDKYGDFASPKEVSELASPSLSLSLPISLSIIYNCRMYTPCTSGLWRTSDFLGSSWCSASGFCAFIV